MTLSRSHRLVRVAALSACLLAVGLVGAQSSSARTYNCSPPQYPDTSRGGYFSQLRVSGYSRRSACRSGRRLALAYYRCRVRRGGIRGNCSGRTVNRLRCRERRDPDLQSRTEINARVTCRRGSRRIVHVYQQNLS